jgi:site-specific recombinase XerD
MNTKCAAFIAWLEHDNMVEVTFEDARDWLDEMIEDGDLSTQSISNYLKAVKALFSHAFERPRRLIGEPKISYRRS